MKQEFLEEVKYFNQHQSTLPTKCKDSEKKKPNITNRTGIEETEGIFL